MDMTDGQDRWTGPMQMDMTDGLFLFATSNYYQYSNISKSIRTIEAEMPGNMTMITIRGL